MQAVQKALFHTDTSVQSPPKTYVKRVYEVYSTVKKCSYVWSVYKLSDPGYLARAAVVSFAVPIAEHTGSETAKKCAFVAAEGLSLVFNPVSWGIGKVCGWVGDKAAHLVQDGLQLQHPELQDLVEIFATECASFSAQVAAKEIHLKRNLTEHEMKKMQVDIKRPEQKQHHKKELHEPSIDAPSRAVELLFEEMVCAMEPSISMPKIAQIKRELEEPIQETPLQIAEKLIMGSSALAAVWLLVHGLAIGFIFTSIALATRLLLDFQMQSKERARDLRVLSQLESLEELKALQKELPHWNKKLDAIISTFPLS